MKTIVYIRVSTQDQSNSVDAQKKNIQDYCSYKGIIIDKIIIDEDISGGMPLYKRPGGSKIQKLIEDGIQFNIIAIKPDRLFRSVSDALSVVDEWNKIGIAIHFIDMGGVALETSTAIGRLVFTTLIAMSEFEKNITGERVKSILKHKKERGDAYCPKVFGFDRIGGTKIGKRTIGGQLVRNETEQTTISLILDMSETHNNNQIAVFLNNNGHKTKTGSPFMCSTIKAILKNNITDVNLIKP